MLWFDPFTMTFEQPQSEPDLLGSPLLAADQFTHSPLSNPREEIRLLHIEEGADEDPIDCMITTWLQSSEPPYHAISYTWGDGVDADETIHINGGPFQVRRNCWDALCQCRSQFSYSREPDYIWIDSICINQDDKPEKNSQVAIMGEIFQRAATVKACIGREDEASRFVHAMLLGIGQKTHRPYPNPFNRVLKAPWIDSIPTVDNTTLCDALLTLHRRPYFSRLWVVQEHRLAQHVDVYCGTDKFFLGALQHLLEEMRQGRCDIDQINGSGFQILIDHGYVRSPVLRNRREHLALLLARFAGFRCADPRDKIFGLLRMVNWEGSDPILPDYNCSLLGLARLALWVFTKSRAADSQGIISSASLLMKALGLTSEHKEMAALLE